MKMYDKMNLMYVNGLMVDSDGNVVAIDNAIVDMANELETRIQKAKYLEAQPEAVAIPTLDGFERESEFKLKKVECTTPVMDERVEESKKIMDELDSMFMTNKVNDDIDRYRDLLLFVKETTVVSAEHEAPHKFDVPTMGSPLDWDYDTMLDFIALANGLKIETEDE